ncbi:MAG: hypothetical protein M1828_007304 [Chrysothrix sp. TS-e1954]|nr:MAG: hypothetical protein M1828_007304 [Chrysothrix sp. TS-e1954]
MPPNPTDHHDTHDQESTAEHNLQSRMALGQDPLQLRRLSTIAPMSTIPPEDPNHVHASMVRPDSSSSGALPNSIMAVVTAPTPQPFDPHVPHTGDYFSSSMASPRRSVDMSERRGSVQHTSLSRVSTNRTDKSLTGSILEMSPQDKTTEELLGAETPRALPHHPTSSESPQERGRPRRSLSEHPQFPNQSLAALSSQQHPQVYPAPYPTQPNAFRGLSSRPVPAFSPRNQPSSHWESRTVADTPIPRPRVHAPRPLRRLQAPSGSEGEDSPFPSPYLHPAQTQPPKETSRAVREIDAEGRKWVNHYEVLRELGRGAHGKVKLARNMENGETVAIKIVQRYSKRRRLGKDKSNPEDKVKKEVAILKKAVHPNVVRMIEVIDDPEINKIYLVLEFCEKHDVKWRMKGVSEVVLLEHRRLMRERNDDADENEEPLSDKIMKALVKRREHKKRPKRPGMPSRVNSESGFWSLEHGTISEDEEENTTFSEPISRVPSRANFSRPPAWDLQNNEEIPPNQLPSLKADARNLEPRDSAPVSDCPSPSMSTSPETTPLREDILMTSGIGDPTRTYPRRASVADSISSHLTELMEDEVPEELQHVPLLTLAECRQAFRDAVLGLEYLHYQGIIHRDIKPENLLRKANDSVKISDFGVSYVGNSVHPGNESGEASEVESHDYAEATELAKTVGTPAFYAPEMCSLDFSGEAEAVTPQIDVWALGITLYCLVYGRVPFIAENQFVLMRHIADDKIFYSHKRLKAVDKYAVISSPHGPLFPEKRDHRLPTDLVYDEIDDELHDLMKRLLIKEPKKRIKIKEVKHHPWVLRGIAKPTTWISDTDPARYDEGKKIEISREEVQEAFQPLTIFDRVKNAFKSTVGTITRSRRRGQSSATSSDATTAGPGSISAPPTSYPTVRPDRLTGLKADEDISSALRASREHMADHLVTRSLQASPEVFSRNASARDATRGSVSASQPPETSIRSPRPLMPGRHESNVSNAASTRTIRQSDINDMLSQGELSDVAPTPRDSNAASTFGAIFTGAGRGFMRTVRSRDRGGDSGRQSPVISASPTPSNDHLHVEPSTAISSTSVSGHVNIPPLRNSPGPSAYSSPSSSKPSSSAALAQYASSHASSLAASPATRGRGYDTFAQARAHNERQLDERFQTSSHNRMDSGSASSSFLQLSASGPSSPRLQSRKNPVSSTSSDDHLHGGMSASTSFPSIPSVVSASSSIVPERGSVELLREHLTRAKADVAPPYAQTIAIPPPSQPLKLTADDDETYDGGGGGGGEVGEPFETDEDDSDSADEGLFLGRRRSRQSPSDRKDTTSHRVPKFRRDTTGSKKSSRSESANTVQKVRSQEPSPENGMNDADRSANDAGSAEPPEL